MFREALRLFPPIDRKLLMGAVYAYFDESGKYRDHTVVSMGVAVASMEAVDRFSEEWLVHLRRAGLDYLTMKQALRAHVPLGTRIPAQTPAERIEALKPFAQCLKNNIEVSVLQAMDVAAFKSLSSKAKKALGDKDEPYYLSFMAAVSQIVQFVGKEDKLCLICDDEEEVGILTFTLYRHLKKIHADIREKVVSVCFADDEAVAPLQAADMLASLMRLEAHRRFFSEPYDYKPLFDFVTSEYAPPDQRMTALTCFWDLSTMQELSERAEHGG